MSPRSKVVWVTVLAVALGAIAWSRTAPRLAPGKKRENVASAGKPAGSLPPLQVSAITIQPQVFAERISATGTIRAEEAVDLQVEVSGKVVSINFREGNAVKKGDLLLKINDSELQASLARAVYRKQIVELKRDRLAPLLKTGGVPQQDFDAVLNDFNVQQAEIDLIEAQIAKTEIRAPFDGVIGLRFISEGTFITATSNAPTRIASLQAIKNLKIDFSVPERYAGRISVGTRITFSVAGGTTRYQGEVYAIEPRVDVATRTILLRALCPNPGATLVPGAFASVECPLSTIDNAILVPSVAVVSGLNEKNVFVVADGKVARRAVEIGTRTESAIHILSGLSLGEQVITSALQQLRPGLPIQVTVENAKPAAIRAGSEGAKPDRKNPAI
ncbi:efflux transporter periplasmic adaptor subunit [Opitutaceae bacterium EW11]|nr:efflux transporter periplasmic adaptor subunit [Opitutaceae bacterium EW11]